VSIAKKLIIAGGSAGVGSEKGGRMMETMNSQGEKQTVQERKKIRRGVKRKPNVNGAGFDSTVKRGQIQGS